MKLNQVQAQAQAESFWMVKWNKLSIIITNLIPIPIYNVFKIKIRFRMKLLTQIKSLTTLREESSIISMDSTPFLKHINGLPDDAICNIT